jgi:hypothetical protein
VSTILPPEHPPTAEQDARLHAKDQMIATLQALVSSLTVEVTSLRSTKKKKEAAKLSTPEEEALIAEVFEDWQKVLGYPERTMTPERRALLLARIQDGFTRGQFQRVWAFAKRDPFMAGDNKSSRRFDDIDTLCKTRTRFEGYLSKPWKPSWGDSRPKPQSEIRGYGL